MMLRLSKLTDYATVIVSHMARTHGEVHTAAEIAYATGVALPTASKILKILAKSGVLTSTRGVKGGYLLAQAPNQITVARVISALEGPIALTECGVSNDGCQQISCCDIRGNWNLINGVIRNALESVTLADMIVFAPKQRPTEVRVPVETLYHR